MSTGSKSLAFLSLFSKNKKSGDTPFQKECRPIINNKGEKNNLFADEELTCALDINPCGEALAVLAESDSV